MTSSTLLAKRSSAIFNGQVSAQPSVFSHSLAELGEGPLWHVGRNSLLWVDILQNCLFEKHLDSGEEQYWQLPHTVSSLAADKTNGELVWLLGESHLSSFDLTAGEYCPRYVLNLAAGYRSNDGVVGPDGRYWFGTMLRQPKPGIGQVFSIGASGDIKQELDEVAIPNTFCWLDKQTVLISDSLKQICRRYQLQANGQLVEIGCFVDLNNTAATPDGGAVDNNGNVWLALWGGAKVVCISPAGQQLAEIRLPVPQPSSCCFGGQDNNLLFITSAREGLTPEQLVQYPDSGKVFCIKLPVHGAAVHQFSVV